MEILPGVHLLERVRGGNVFLLNDPACPTLIDAGLPRSGRRILQSLKETGLAPTDLEQVLLTHFHVDHSGGAAEVRQLTGARVLCHPADAALLRPGPGRRGRPWRRFAIQEMPVDGLLAEGQVLPVLGGLQVLQTPGHTPGSLSFYLLQQRAIFVGDLFLNIGGRLSQPILRRPEDREMYESSLRRVAELEVEACLPAHGPAILSGAAELIWRLVEARSARGRGRGLLGALRDVPRVLRFGIGFLRKGRGG